MLFDNSMLNVYKIVSKYRRFTNLDPIEGDWNPTKNNTESVSLSLLVYKPWPDWRGLKLVASQTIPSLSIVKFTNLDPIEGDWNT